MTFDLDSVPVVGRAYSLGVSRVTTTLVLLGPVLILAIAVVGRNPVTVGLGIAYVLSLPVSVGYFWITNGDEADENGESK